jgi:hypothetical protein
MVDEVEEVFPMAIDYTYVLYIGTQQSCNMQKGKGKEVVELDEDEEEIEGVNVSDDEDFYYDGEYRADLRVAEREAAIAAEMELM